MSLACFECGETGSFNTLILFSKNGKFNVKKEISEYENFYTCCAKIDSFEAVKKSRFMIVETADSESSWHTGSDGDTIKKTRHKLISEEELEKKLPKIYRDLVE